MDDKEQCQFIEAMRRNSDRLVSPYTSATARIVIQCGLGHRFETTPDAYVRGCGCDICAAQRRDKWLGERPKIVPMRPVAPVTAHDTRRLDNALQLLQQVEVNRRQADAIRRSDSRDRVAAAREARSRQLEQNRELRIARRKRHQLDSFMAALQDSGDQLVPPYEAFETNVEIRCSCGHAFRMKPKNYVKGTRCRSCKARKSELLDH